jgi:hypothetical protein
MLREELSFVGDPGPGLSAPRNEDRANQNKNIEAYLRTFASRNVKYTGSDHQQNSSVGRIDSKLAVDAEHCRKYQAETS